MRLIGLLSSRQWAWTFGTVAVLVIALGAAVALFLQGPPSYQPKSLPRTAPSVTPSVRAAVSPGVTPQVFARSTPTSVVIPSIGVNAHIMDVYDPGGTLQTPPLTGAGAYEVGWWAGLSPSDPQASYSPGQDGPAVLVGHVNSAAQGDLVFGNLSKLVAGNTVTVYLADGKQVVFTVTTLQEAPKTAFPTQAVYGATTDPELRLITCGGQFDAQTGHYLDNLIVYLKEAVS